MALALKRYKIFTSLYYMCWNYGFVGLGLLILNSETINIP